jgi:hypothetical protein
LNIEGRRCHRLAGLGHHGGAHALGSMTGNGVSDFMGHYRCQFIIGFREAEHSRINKHLAARETKRIDGLGIINHENSHSKSGRSATRNRRPTWSTSGCIEDFCLFDQFDL